MHIFSQYTKNDKALPTIYCSLAITRGVWVKLDQTSLTSDLSKAHVMRDSSNSATLAIDVTECIAIRY